MRAKSQKNPHSIIKALSTVIFLFIITGCTHLGLINNPEPASNKDIERLVSMGAELKEGPREVEGGPIIAFISAPGDIRIELIQSR